MNKIKFYILAISGLIALGFFAASCGNSDKDEEANCSDGILNQGETAIDCGGPCAACPVLLCDGNGENTFLPLKVGNYWKYKSELFSTSVIYNCIDIDTIEGVAYFTIEGSDSFGWDDKNYYRKATNGDIYVMRELYDDEVLFLPNNPAVGYEWFDNEALYSWKVTAIDATYETSDCDYTGLLEIEEYFSGELQDKYYYKKGLGLVNQLHVGTISYDTYLTEVTFD